MESPFTLALIRPPRQIRNAEGVAPDVALARGCLNRVVYILKRTGSERHDTRIVGKGNDYRRSACRCLPPRN